MALVMDDDGSLPPPPPPPTSPMSLSSKGVDSSIVSGMAVGPSSVIIHQQQQQSQQPDLPTTSSMFQPEINFSYYNSAPFYGGSKPHHIRDFSDVPKTEENLLQLLSDFHQGKLHAFGENVTLDNMIKLRQQQENLARLHFELNTQQSNKPLPQQQTSRSGADNEDGGPEDGDDLSNVVASKPFSKTNMIKLIQNLQNLCQSIEQLQSKSSND